MSCLQMLTWEELAWPAASLQMALTADARLPLGPAWVGMSCRAERYRQEEHVLVASRGQKVRTVQSALHQREKEKLLC